MNNKDIIARKYAKAFLHIFIDKMTLNDFHTIKKLESFFSNHKKTLFFLSIPNINPEQKYTLLVKLLKQFEAFEHLEALIRLLLNHKRVFLIKDVLKQIILLYKELKNIMLFNITSSDQLDESSLEIIEKFLATNSGKNIIWQHKIDKNLVAGIRLKSDSLLWEYSIQKQCKTLRQQFNI